MLRIIEGVQSLLLPPKIRVIVAALALTMVGCQGASEQHGPVTPAVQTEALAASESNGGALPVQGSVGPFVRSNRIISELKAAGFSVADPNVKWGVTIYVDAEQPTGGFRAEAQEGMITIHWAKLPDATGYEIFRSIQPVIPLMMDTALTMDAGQNSSDADNHWSDNKVAPGAQYYYFVLATTKSGSCSVAATGNAATPASGQPQTRLQGTDGVMGQANLEAEDRNAIRQKDGVTSLDMGQSTSSAPRGTYGFCRSFGDGTGDFTFYTEDAPEKENAPFEIHKMCDGQFRLVGYVDSDTAKKIREGKAGWSFTVYARRWPGANEIVSLPIKQFSNWSPLKDVTVNGTRNFTVKVDWK